MAKLNLVPFSMNPSIYTALLIICLCLPISVSAQDRTITDRDSLALISLFEATGGPNWKTQDGDGTRSDWVFTGNDPEQPRPASGWSGVILKDMQVERLFLSSVGMVGQLPDGLGNLAQPLTISITNNSGDNGNLTGPISDTLGSIASLEQLSLSRNALNGPIPESLGRLKNLQQLFLSHNQLTGFIPDTLGTLSNLKILDLSDNQLTGALSDSVGNLTHLEVLDLFNNQLTGDIPSSLGNLTNLRQFRLGSTSFEGGNQLSGPIPQEIGNLTALLNLDVFGNALNGPIPASLGNLTNLSNLQLGGNQLEGPIPEELGNLSSIITITLAFNRLTGAVPESFTQLATLQTLNLHENELDSLPDLSDLPALRQLRVFNNRLTFKDLEPLAGLRDDPNVTIFFYAPQDSVDTHIIREDGEVQLFISVGGEDTTYRWFQDNEEIEDATDSTYVLPDPNDTASYHAEARNPLLPDLVLFSRPVQVNTLRFLVNSTGDLGLKADAPEGTCDTGGLVVRVALEEPECTLRAAIEAANRATGGTAQIHFDVPDAAIPVIRPETPLADIEQPIVLDGTTQPGGGLVRLDGNTAGADTHGLQIEASNSMVQGLLVDGFDESGIRIFGDGNTVENCTLVGNGSSGIDIQNASHNTIRDNVLSGNQFTGVRIDLNSMENQIESNRIGTEADGSTALPNLIGVFITDRATMNTVSDNVIAENRDAGVVIGSLQGVRPVDNTIMNNTISGNARLGIGINGEHNQILGNKIGTTNAGLAAWPNGQFGVLIQGANNTLQDNTISGNGLGGVFLEQASSDGNILQNNRIGTDFTGQVALPNGKHGIEIDNAPETKIYSNVISGNAENGILVVGRGATGTKIERNNFIGTSADGFQPLGNGGHGIQVDVANPFIRNNLISANAQSGILLSGSNSILRVSRNKIGTDVLGRDILGTMGNREHGVHLKGTAEVNLIDNLIAFNFKAGLLMDSVQPGNLIALNTILRNVTGINIDGDVGGDIRNNRIHLNIRNINATDVLRDLIIENNDIFDGTGIGTGIHLTNARAIIRGNTLTGDAGDAITLEQGSEATITNNNIFDNQGFGLNNLDASVSLQAQDNWWGDASGPSGQGPGTGEAVSAGIDFSNWRSEMVTVVLAPEAERVILPVATPDTVAVFAQNWQVRDDVLDLSVSEDQGWLQGPTTFTVTLEDSLGAAVPLPILIPPGTPDGTTNTLNVAVTSQTNVSHTATTTLTLIAQTAALAQVAVVPSEVEVAPEDTVQFVALGFDQFGQAVNVMPTWNATGGTIDANGLYVAGTTTGVFEVTATDPATMLSGTARVGNGVPVAIEEADDVPTAFRLDPNYPNPFNPETTIRYIVAKPGRVRLAVYDVLGREVTVLVDGMDAAGQRQVVFDARHLSNGVYFYRLTAAGFSKTRTMVLLR